MSTWVLIRMVFKMSRRLGPTASASPPGAACKPPRPWVVFIVLFRHSMIRTLLDYLDMLRLHEDGHISDDGSRWRSTPGFKADGAGSRHADGRTAFFGNLSRSML